MIVKGTINQMEEKGKAMKRFLLGMLLMVGVAISAFAQSGSSRGTVSGTVIDDGDKSPVIQATVQLLSVKDSSMVVGNVTDMNGHFSLSVRPGKYLLKVSYIGYTPFFKQVALTRNAPRVNVGKVQLATDAIMLAEAVVVAQAPEVTAAEDTLVYNSSAYRVPEGSALEELVKKLPGAEVDENGKITINGKEIKKIMIDGKEFFADDPNIAMKNLPVNIIDKVRAYDKQSDLARVTGIDDGEEETVLDLSVKPGMNKGWFGNADLAAGTEDRYSSKVMLHRFVGNNQFTVIGSMNNVNDNGYPGGGGGFRWGGQNGLTSIKMGGFNFSTQSEKLETGGSVNYNYKDADIISKQASETFVSTESSSFKNAMTANRNKTTSLTADFRIEWKPDTMTTIIIRPRLTYGKNNNGSNSNSFTFNQDPGYTTDEILNAGENLSTLIPEEAIINTIARNSLQKSSDFNVGGSAMINRRLGKAGRNITFCVTFNYTISSCEQFSVSDLVFFLYTYDERLEILNRYITTPTLNYNYSARFTYSEPIFKGGFLQFSYNFQYKRSKSDNSTYTMPEDWVISQGFGGDHTGELDTQNSKSAQYTYYNHQADISLRWIREKMRLNAGFSFQPQKSKLSYKKDQLDTVAIRNVFNFTPTFDFRYNFSKTSQLRINYRGRSSQPSMTDLLPIEDTTDPLNIRRGNPGLKPAFTNTFMAFYNTFDTKKQRGIMTHFRFENVMNSISNRSTYDPTTGGTITQPENINGNWNLFGILGSNTALRNKKYTINTFTMARYNNIVSYMSDTQSQGASDKNKTRQLSLSERLRGTYRNDWWEFSLNGSLAYTHSRNSFQEENNMDTYQFSYGASTNVRLPWNMSIATDISQNSRRGYADASMNRDELIWNAQISQDFLKGNAATVSIQFYDILRNQSNISRVISAAMRSD